MAKTVALFNNPPSNADRKSRKSRNEAFFVRNARNRTKRSSPLEQNLMNNSYFIDELDERFWLEAGDLPEKEKKNS